LRAIFELALRDGSGPVRAVDIAEAQAVPHRFLEVILNQLKQAGFVDSRRGAAGGYGLARSPKDLTLGEVIRFFEGPLQPVTCVTGHAEDKCPLYGDCVFLEVWAEAEKAMSEVFDRATFQDLVDRQRRKGVSAAAYSI